MKNFLNIITILSVGALLWHGEYQKASIILNLVQIALLSMCLAKLEKMEGDNE